MPRPAQPRWTPQEDALLLKHHPDYVAKVTGRSVLGVRHRRWKLGLPDLRYMTERVKICRSVWTPEADEIVCRCKPADAAKLLGIGRTTVKSRRRLLHSFLWRCLGIGQGAFCWSILLRVVSPAVDWKPGAYRLQPGCRFEYSTLPASGEISNSARRKRNLSSTCKVGSRVQSKRQRSQENENRKETASQAHPAHSTPARKSPATAVASVEPATNQRVPPFQNLPTATSSPVSSDSTLAPGAKTHSIHSASYPLMRLVGLTIAVSLNSKYAMP